MEVHEEIAKELLSPNQQPQQGVIEEKFVVIITRYPNGKCFPEIFPIGITARKNKNVSHKRKKLQQVQIGTDEVY